MKSQRTVLWLFACLFLQGGSITATETPSTSDFSSSKYTAPIWTTDDIDSIIVLALQAREGGLDSGARASDSQNWKPGKYPFRDGRLSPVRELQLDKLFECFDQVDENRLAGYINRIRRDPMAFAEAVLGNIMDKNLAHFDLLMKDDIAKLMSGGIESPSSKEIALSAKRKVTNLAAKHQMANCAIQHLNRIQPENDWNLSAIASSLQDKIQKQEEFLKTKIEEPLHGAIGAGLTKVLSNENVKVLLTEEELQAVASGVYAKYMISQLNISGDAVRSLLDAMENQEERDIAEVNKNLHVILSPKQQYPQGFARDFDVALVRAMAHKYVDSVEPGHGGYFVNYAVGLLQVSEGTAEKVTETVCGLVPEVGGAVCAMVIEILDIAWNYGAIPRIEAKITEKLHEKVDEAVNSVEENTGRPGSGAPIARAIYDIVHEDVIDHNADEHLQDTRTALDGFNAGVRELAEAASN